MNHIPTRRKCQFKLLLSFSASPARTPRPASGRLTGGAALTGVVVNDPKRFPKLEDAFTSLFERKEQQDWWIMKQRVESYAKAKKADHS